MRLLRMTVTIEDMSFSYETGSEVLSDISMKVNVGEVVAITGPSGSGKSTLLQLIGGLLTPTSGSISGRPRSDEVQWVFQTPIVLGRRSVLDNVLLGLHSRRWPDPTAREMAMSTAAAVDLADLADRQASSLSGGELQRTQIARTLVGAPQLVLADEPTGQLDRASTDLVVAALLAAKEARSTVVVATHDPVVASAGDRHVELLNGRVIEAAI